MTTLLVPSPLFSSMEIDNVVLISHPPIFVLKVHNSIHTLTSEYVGLFFFIPQYYFIISETSLFRKYTYAETNARAPPAEVLLWQL